MSERVLIVGEVLFDHFEDGRRVAGGAPFNVAWNLRGLGLHPTLVSAVGDDPEGRTLRDLMEAWDMDTRALQVTPERPTGAVQVTLDGGQPSYTILTDQAYDHVALPDLPLDGYGLLYTGSLAYRSEPTRSTIAALSASGLPRFVDLNIRRPWFDAAWLPELLTGASWLKLNDDELRALAGGDADAARPDTLRAAARQLRQRYGVQRLLITAGAAGAYAVDEGGQLTHAAAPPPDPMIDTVGAGDAFAAAMIAGLLGEHPLGELLHRAVAFASRTCSLRGATTRDMSHYRGFR